MSKVPASFGTNPNPEGDKNDWKIKTHANGLLFYFNTKTKKSQWEKPDVLKTAEELLNSTDWQEQTTSEGKTFYYNAKIKQSVWKMPPELKAIKEKQAELAKLAEGQKGSGPKISVSITSSIPHTQEVENPKDYDNLSHEESVKIFMDMLRDRCQPTMKWEQALQIIKNDERLKVIKGIGEQRRLFKEWINQTKIQERQEQKQRLQKARENFRVMLEDKKVLDSDSKYYKVFHLFVNDYRWKALEDREREQIFQDYLDDLYEKEKEDSNKKIKQYREDLRKILSQDPEITSLSKWHEVSEKYKENKIWAELPDYDKLQVFSRWVIELDKNEHEEKRKNRRMTERKNREAFRELLKEHIDRGTLTYKTKWRHFIEQIKEDKRLFNMLGQNGSTPRELFEDQIEVLKDNHKRIKEDFKKLIKDNPSIKAGAETPFESFDSALKGQEDYDKLDAKTKELFYNYFVDKAKAKEKESNKKHRRAMRKYTRFLRKLPNLKPDSEYKTFEKEINENELFAALKEEEKVAGFTSFLQDLKTQDEGQISGDEGDADKHKKKRSKKKRKNKKKAYDSSDNEDHSSDESRSPSRSPSPDHKRSSKKERKSHKRDHSASEEYSDGEKKPEKKIFNEADLARNAEVSKAQEENKIQEEKQPAKESTTKEDKEEREEGETKESLARGRRSSISSRSESHERRKKKKDRKHSKKSKKSDRDRKSKKKHKKHSYSPSDSSDDD